MFVYKASKTKQNSLYQRRKIRENGVLARVKTPRTIVVRNWQVKTLYLLLDKYIGNWLIYYTKQVCIDTLDIIATFYLVVCFYIFMDSAFD